MIKAVSLLKIFKNSPLSAVILLPDTPEFTVVEVSDRFIKETGRRANDIIGKSIFANFSGSDSSENAFEDFKYSLQNVLDTGLPQKLIIENVEIGETVPILSETGEIEYLIHSYFIESPSNIFCGDKKWLNEKKELKSSEEEYKTLFRLSPIPKLIYDPETFEIYNVNESTTEKYGYSREDFQRLKLNDLVSVEHLPKFYEAHKINGNREGRIDFGHFIHLKKDKTPVHVEMSGNRFTFKGKSCMMLACIDVTERENALAQLKDNRQKLLAAENIAKIGYWKLDLKNHQLFWSDEVYKILGLDKDKFKVDFDSFYKKIHPEDKAAFSKERDTCSGR